MCKRFSFKVSEEQIEQEIGIPMLHPLRWSYNIAPTHHAYVILDESPERLQYITWGLIPANSRDGKNEGKLINARKEGIGVSSSFRIPIRSKRCLVLADSFYCWHKEGLSETPYRVTHKEGNILMLAGVWDVWLNGEYAVKSFSIITKPTTNNLKTITMRSPVILNNKTTQKNWLEDIPLSRVQSIIDSRDDNAYDYYKVSSEVRSIKNNDESLHQKIN